MMAGLVTDSRGCAQMRLPDTDLMLYASTTTHYGLAILKAGVASGPVRLTMRPLATMRIRVVDAARAPVVGAWIELAEVSAALGDPRPDQSEETFALTRIAVGLVTRPHSDGDRTNRDGEILVRFLDSSAVVYLRACLGGRKSGPTARRAGDELREITMH